MKFNKDSTILGAFFFSLFSLLMFFQVWINGCLLWTCAPHRWFGIKEMSIPSQLLPNEAYSSGMIEPSEPEGSTEAGIQTIHWANGNGLANYSMWRFSTGEKAEQFYERSTNLSESGGSTSIFEFSSIYADEFDIQCGESLFGGYRCLFTARYMEYAVIFSSVMDQNMPNERYEGIIRFIDSEFSCRLYQICDESPTGRRIN